MTTTTLATNTHLHLHKGYIPGLTGRMISMHMSFYHALFGWNEPFESHLADGLGELVPRLDGVNVEIWTLFSDPSDTSNDTRKAGDILGTIVIDTTSRELAAIEEAERIAFLDRNAKVGEGDASTEFKPSRKAHLRFFFVDEMLKGRGAGKRLLGEVLEWVDERGLECHLWTSRGLGAAKGLYDREGFVAVGEEWSGKFGGEEVCHLRMVRGRRVMGEVVR